MKRCNIKGIGSPLLISIYFDQETEQMKKEETWSDWNPGYINFMRTLVFGSRSGMAQYILNILISCMHRTNGADAYTDVHLYY